MADGISPNWFTAIIGGITGIITGGTLINSVRSKVNAHDKLIYKEKGGLNIVDVKSCEKNMEICKSHFTDEIRKVVRKEFEEHRKQSVDSQILDELKKLNGG